MKKNEYMKGLNEIQDMTMKMKKISCLNEAMSFDDYNDYDDEEMPMEDEEGEGMGNLQGMHDDVQPMEKEQPQSKGEAEEMGMDQLTEVDQIREIALRGMIKLCKNPMDPQYMALKKVFQFCDKAAEDKDKEENPEK